MVNGQVSCEIARLGSFQRILLRDKIAEGLSAITRTFASHIGEEPTAPSCTYRFLTDDR